MGVLGYDRIEDDFYPTPTWCVDALLNALSPTPFNLDIEEPMWEPACGDGAISKALEAYGFEVDSSDLIDRGFGQGGVDFLETRSIPGPHAYDALVTNPPYDMAEKFVRHGLTFVESGKVQIMAMLLRNEWDSAKSRNDLFLRKNHFAGKVILTSRPKWIAGSTGSPRHNYAWFLWSHEEVYELPVILYGHKA